MFEKTLICGYYTRNIPATPLPMKIGDAHFGRVFYFYESQNLAVVKAFAKKFGKVNAYKKADGKWVKDLF